MAEAIAQIRREASGFTNELEELNRQAVEAVRNLDQFGRLQGKEPALGAAAQQLERYRQRQSAGEMLPESDLSNLRNILDVIGSRGGQPGQQYLSILRRIEQLQRPEQFVSRPLLDDELRVARERRNTDDPALARAQEEELSRARMVGDVMIIQPPRPKPGPQPGAEAAGPGQGPGTGDEATFQPDSQQDPRPAPKPGPEPTRTRPAGGPQLARPEEHPGPPIAEAEETRQAVRTMTQAFDSEAAAKRRRDIQTRASAMTERELQREWRESSRALNQHLGDLERSGDRLRRYQRIREEHKADPNRNRDLTDAERRSARWLRDDRPGLQRNVEEAQLRHDALREAAEQRGAEIDGPNLIFPRGKPGMLRQAATGFMGAGGFGGGFGGLIAAAALNFGGVPGLLGALAGGGFAYGRRQYSKHVEELIPFEELGRLLGRNPYELLRQNRADTEQSRIYDQQEVAQVTRMLGQTVGSTNPTGVLATAAVAGVNPIHEAMRIAQAAQFMPTLAGAEDASLATLAAFRRSGATRMQAGLTGTVPGSSDAFSASEIDRKRQEIDLLEKLLAEENGNYPGRDAYVRQLEQLKREVAAGPRHARGPDFEPLLYSTFADSALRSYASLSSNPFIPADRAGATDVLSDATHVRTPGIDPMSHAGIRAAEARVANRNAFTQPGGGIFEEMQTLGVLRLRGTPTAQKLKEMGIDISTPIGVWRAMQQAAQLATRGVPEVQHAMFKSVEEMMPDRDLRAMALMMGGRDPESAFQISDDIDRVTGLPPEALGKRRQTEEQRRQEQQDLRDAGHVITKGSLRTGAADEIYENKTRPSLTASEAGDVVAQTDLGLTLTKAINDGFAMVVDGLTTMLQAEINVPERDGR